jgi:hypothetical protein
MKSITYTFFPIGLILLMMMSSCNFSGKSKEHAFNPSNTLDQLEVLLTQLNELDTTDCANLDEIVSINEKMRRIVENIRSAESFDQLAKTYKTQHSNVKFMVSEDMVFGIFSWRTKMDCLGNQIKNIALYKTDKGILASSLYGTPRIYHKVGSSSFKKGRYILYADNLLKGYSISNGYLEEIQLGPNEASYVKNELFEDE